MDGLLNRGDSYAGLVIVKSDLNYGGLQELKALTLSGRALRRLRRMLSGQPARTILTKADYRIFPSLGDVPPEYFTPDNVVQKLILEKDGEKNLLREYMFLGNLHYENIERSSAEIITEDEHISCEPFVPHPRLLRLRRQLNLGYGKIDYVMEGVGLITANTGDLVYVTPGRFHRASFAPGDHAAVKALAADLLARATSAITQHFTGK